MPRSYKQGRFIPRNPEKYVGKVDKIIFRSSWELRFNEFLDGNPNILRWSSEELVVPYIKPTDNKVHRYFPDYWIEYKNRSGQIVREVIEVKPACQTTRSRRRNPRTQLVDDITLAINTAKWKAAQQFCEKNNMKFRILTENELFKNGKIK